MGSLEEALIDSAAEEDVLFVLYHLAQGGLLIDGEHPTTKLTALQTVASLKSRQATLIVQILLLNGASSVVGGASGSALDIARKNGNNDVVKIMLNWEKGARESAAEASFLLSQTVEEAETWLQAEFPIFEQEALAKQKVKEEAVEQAVPFDNFVMPKPEPQDDLMDYEVTLSQASNAIPSTSTLPSHPQILIRGIALSCTLVTLGQRFSEYKPTIDLRRNEDELTALAYFSFPNPSSGEALLRKYDGSLLAGSVLRIERLDESFSVEGESWSGETVAKKLSINTVKPSVITEETMATNLQSQYDSEKMARLFVANLTDKIDLSQLASHFATEVKPQSFSFEALSYYKADRRATYCNIEEDLAPRLISRFNHTMFMGNPLIVEYWKAKTLSLHQVFIAAVPKTVSIPEIIHFFQPVTILSAEDIRLRPAKDSTQYGFISLPSEAAIYKAIAILHGSQLKGKRITVEQQIIKTRQSISHPSRNSSVTITSPSTTQVSSMNGIHPSRAAQMIKVEPLSAEMVTAYRNVSPPKNNWGRNKNPSPKSSRRSRSRSPAPSYRRGRTNSPRRSSRDRSFSPVRRRSRSRSRSRFRSRSPRPRSRSPLRSSRRSRSRSRSRSPRRHSSRQGDSRKRETPASSRPKRSPTLSSKAEVFAPRPHRSRSDSMAPIPPGTPPPTDSNNAQSIQERLDESRLESLNLSRDDIQSVKRLWQPIFHPPTPDFNRTIELKVTYGWVAPEIAKKALLLPTPFPTDPNNAALFEAFLKAQTGESRDHYTIFFAQLSEWNSNVALFVKTAKAAIAAQKQKELLLIEEKEYDINGNSKGLKLESMSRKSNSSSSRKAKKYDHKVTKFEFPSKIRNYFGLRDDKMRVD